MIPPKNGPAKSVDPIVAMVLFDIGAFVQRGWRIVIGDLSSVGPKEDLGRSPHSASLSFG